MKLLWDVNGGHEKLLAQVVASGICSLKASDHFHSRTGLWDNPRAKDYYANNQFQCFPQIHFTL